MRYGRFLLNRKASTAGESEYSHHEEAAVGREALNARLRWDAGAAGQEQGLIQGEAVVRAWSVQLGERASQRCAGIWRDRGLCSERREGRNTGRGADGNELQGDVLERITPKSLLVIPRIHHPTKPRFPLRFTHNTHGI